MSSEDAQERHTEMPREGRGAEVVARKLTRRFGEHLALDGIDLRIAPGETLGLLGANGAGKTTFIRLVTGYLLPSSGEVSVDGFSSASKSREVHRRIGYATETSRIYPELPVSEFLRFMAGARGMDTPSTKLAIEKVIEHFELGEVANRPMGHLSKGYQQRVSLAQSFMNDPSLLIVDEPTGGLDPYQQAEVREILHQAQRTRTILLCTHDLAEARALASRVAILRHGKLVALGATEEVLGRDNSLDLFHEAEAPLAGSGGTRP